tara:strand:+ start:936 stop:1865 length:930 start_codon:yes stop_codon:yes gene_type:complete
MPYQIFLFLPIISLLASLFVVVNMVRCGEFSVLKSFGLNMWRLTLPFLYCGVLVCLLGFCLNEIIIPTSFESYHTFENEIFGSDVRKNKAKPVSWLKVGRDFLRFDSFNHKTNEFSNLFIYTLNDNATVPKVLYASKGVYDSEKGTYDFPQYSKYLFDPSLSLTQGSLLKNGSYFFGQNIDDLEDDKISFDRMSIYELTKKINSYQASNRDSLSLRVTKHLKIAYPFSCLLMCLVGLLLSNVSIDSKKFYLMIVYCLIIGSFFWILLIISRLLSFTGILKPFIGGWLPNFSLFSFLLFALTRMNKRIYE